MKLKHSLLLLLLVMSIHMQAQQRVQFTQYMINPFLYNPAIAGTEDYADIRVGYRKQWAGFEGSPRSVFLSGHTSIGKSKVVNSRVRSKKKGFHGVGALITNDQVGPTQMTTIRAAYANHLKLSNTVYASLGIMAGLNQYVLNSELLNSASGFDAAIVGNSSRSLADINIGGWVYSDKFYAGATMIQVVPQKLYGTEAVGKALNHFMVTAGYKFPLGSDFTFIPSFVVKAVAPAPISYDINAKIRYQDIGWVGVSYRRTDAMAVMAGIIISETVDLSYSYDASTSNIRKYSGGSHEIILGYRLRTKVKVKCPSNFW